MHPPRSAALASLASLAAILPLLAAPAAALAGITNTPATGPSNHFARTPYVQLATPSSMVIVWRTHGPIDPVVRIGRQPRLLDRSITATTIVTRVALTTNRTELARLAVEQPELLRLPRLHSAPVGIYQYEAHIRGLSADTRYYYAVYDGERRLTEADDSYRFATHPLPGTARPTRFWVVGDSGTGRQTQWNVHTAMTNVVARERRPLDLYLHVGDMAYQRGRDVEFQTRFFEPYDATLRHTVCWASMGNHEGGTSRGTNGIGPYYDAYVLPARGEAGGVASGSEAFYSFDYGRIHFICLNSHDLDRKPTGMMARWLKMDLERTRADWLIAYWHHPPYTKGTHNSDREKQLVEMRTHIMPILESGGVDLVLTGHSHIYERSMLIDGAYATPTVAEGVVFDDREGSPEAPYRKSAGLVPNNGAIQVVAGHGGAGLGRKGTIPFMRKIIVEHGSCLIDIDGDTLRGRMINKFGEIRDDFALVKRGRVRQERLLDPWQPPDVKPPRSSGGDPGNDMPEDFFPAIVRHSQDWLYLAGKDVAGLRWTERDFPAQGWPKGQAPFGYGYPEAKTQLADMRNGYQRIYLLHEFQVEHADYVAEAGLVINYDDAFIAYLNGKEVLRKNVGRGAGKDAKDIKPHDGAKYRYYVFKDFEKHLKDGRNVLAIEGHNATLDSSDFLMDPYLILEE
ncbi:MAG: Alkaline phosphatase precursor [Verrucomicrobiota bacterium]